MALCNCNIARQEELRVPDYRLRQVARIAYWNFKVWFWDYRDTDNRHFETLVMGPSGVSMLDKVLNIMTTPQNVVKLDVGLYQSDYWRVYPDDIEVMRTEFIQTYGNINDYKEWEWPKTGNE